MNAHPHTHTHTPTPRLISTRHVSCVIWSSVSHGVGDVVCHSHSHYTHTLLVVLPPPWVQTVLHAAPCGCRRGRKEGRRSWAVVGVVEGAAVLWASLAHRYTGTQHCHHSVFSLPPSPTHQITILSTMTASVKIRKLDGKWCDVVTMGCGVFTCLSWHSVFSYRPLSQLRSAICLYVYIYI